MVWNRNCRPTRTVRGRRGVICRWASRVKGEEEGDEILSFTDSETGVSNGIELGHDAASDESVPVGASRASEYLIGLHKLATFPNY